MPFKSAQGHRLQSLMFFNYHKIGSYFTPDRRHRKRSEHVLNADHKSLETVFSIAICLLKK